MKRNNHLSLTEGQDMAIIVEVTARGPVELAGLRKGDLILLVDGGTLAQPHFTRLAIKHEPKHHQLIRNDFINSSSSCHQTVSPNRQSSVR